MRRVALVVGVVAALGGLSAPGYANLQPAIVVGPNQSVTKSFPAILAANPAPKGHVDDLNLPEDPGPASCPNLPTCDEIPLILRRPAGLSVFDSYTFRVEVTWDGASDLDVYLWNEPPGPTPTRRARTNANPEVIDYPAIDRQSFHLDVNNAAGVNGGYTVKVTTRYARGERPSEAATSPSFDSPLDTVPSLTTTPSTELAAVATTTSIVPGDLIDPDLGNLSAAGPAPDIFRGGDAGDRPAAPVAGSTVFWRAGVLPFVVAGACGWVLYRRRPRALSYRRAPTSRR